MNAERLLLGVTFALTGALMIGLGLPLARRRVKPNRLYGTRTKDTLADARVWYEVNAVGGRDLVRLGLFSVAVAAVFLVVPEPWLGGAVMACSGVLVVGALAMAVRGVRMAKRLRAEVEARDRGNRPA